MRACNIPVTDLEEALAAYRTAWSQCTVSGVRSFEEQRQEQLDAKRQARKNRSVNLTAILVCLVCHGNADFSVDIYSQSVFKKSKNRTGKVISLFW